MRWLLVPQAWHALQQRVQQQRQRYFPHISPLRPRLLDIVRYALKSLWLLMVLPLDDSARKRFNAFGSLFRWRQQLHQWLAHLPRRG